MLEKWYFLVSELIADNKKITLVVIGVLTFSKRIWKKMVGVFSTGKTILTAINGLSATLLDIKQDIGAVNRTVIKNDQLFKSSMDLEDNGRFETDKDGNITWANKYILDLLGVQKDEFYGRSWFNLIEPSYMYETMYEWKHKIMAGHNISKEIAMMDNAGNHVYVKITARIVRDKGEVISYVGTMKKIQN